VSGSSEIQALIGAHYLPTHTICILISAHTIHCMGIIQTVNLLVHLVPFLLMFQLYHPSPSHTLGLFHPFHHVHNKKQNSGCTYVVKLLNNCIKKCRGCGAAFLRKVDGSPPEPPNNLVIVMKSSNHFLMRRTLHVWIDLRMFTIMFPAFSTKTHHLLPQRFKYLQTLSYCHLHERYLEDHFGWRSCNYFLTSSANFLCGTVTIYVSMHLSTVSKIVNCKIWLGTLFLYVYLPLMIGDKIPEEEPLWECCILLLEVTE